MKCRWVLVPDDRRRVVFIVSRHVEDCSDPGCAACLPCERRHCTSCTVHLEATEAQTCQPCRHQARRDLLAIVDLAALLPDHAVSAARDGRLAAAADIPGGPALVMLSRGSAGWSDDDETTRADEPHPPAWLLGWWAEQWRTRLGGPAPTRPANERRPARLLLESVRYLGAHHDWAASHHPGWHTYAADLARTRRLLEELLHAGDHPTEGVPCFHCDTTLVRDYRPPAPCTCGPPPPPSAHMAHHRTDACCLGCAAHARWELLGHDRVVDDDGRVLIEGHDQGGLDTANRSSGWYCPGCGHTYSVGEYDLALRTDHSDAAPALPVRELADRTGIPQGTIRRWAGKQLRWSDGEPVHEPARLRPCGKSHDGRKLYRVADVLKLRAPSVSLDIGQKP